MIEPEYRTFSIKLNTRHGPFADVELRKAVSYAFNYKAMLDAAGYADLMTGRCRTASSGHNPQLQVYRTDLAKAREHLAKSKHPNGGIKLTMVHVSGLDQQRRWALVLLDSLKQLNIELDIKPMIWPDMVAACRSPETFRTSSPSTRRRTTAIPTTSPSPPITRRATATGRMPSTQSGGGRLIEQGRAEQDEAKRIAIYREFQEKVVADAPDIFGVLERRKLALRDNVQKLPLHARRLQRDRGLRALAPLTRRGSAAAHAELRDPADAADDPGPFRADHRRLRHRPAAAGRPGRARRRPECDPAEIAAYGREFGLDRPIVAQYWTYLTGLLRGDFGVSIFTRRPVGEDLVVFLPATLELVLAAMFIAVVVGVPAGLAAAVWRDRWPDYVSRVAALGAISMPRFFLGLLLQLAFAMWLGLLPLGGRFPSPRTRQRSSPGS